MDNDQALELLGRIAQKDQRAMETLYRSYAGIVQHFASRTLNNPTDAVEVANEVFMEVWRKADAFEGRSAVRTWLLSITHNKAVDLVRRKARHDSNVDLDDQHDIKDEGLFCDAERLQENRDYREHLEHCMQGLKDGHRQTVYLTFFEELSYPDVAQIMGIPAGTVKTRMMHAKKQLMACLKRLMPTPAGI